MERVTNETDRPPWRAARETRGLGLRETARLARIDPAQLSRVERGQSQLSVASTLRLARVLRLHGLVRQLDPFTHSGENLVGPDRRREHDGHESET